MVVGGGMKHMKWKLLMTSFVPNVRKMMKKIKKEFVNIDFGKLESRAIAKLQEDYSDFDPYSFVAQKHGVERSQVKACSFHIFYDVGYNTSPNEEQNPEPHRTVERIEQACRRAGLIK